MFIHWASWLHDSQLISLWLSVNISTCAVIFLLFCFLFGTHAKGDQNIITKCCLLRHWYTEWHCTMILMNIQTGGSGCCFIHVWRASVLTEWHSVQFNSYLPSGCKHLGILYICTVLSVSVNSLLSCIKVDSLFTWMVCSRVTTFEGIKNFLTFFTWLVSLDVCSRLTAYIDSVFKVDSLMDSLFKVNILHG